MKTEPFTLTCIGDDTAELLIFFNDSFDFGLNDAIGSGDNSSTHLFASLGPWHTAVIRSISGPLISNAFFIVSVSSNRVMMIPVSGSLP